MMAWLRLHGMAFGATVGKLARTPVASLLNILVIGVALVAEGMGHYLPKGYIYGPMAFAFFVDVLQMRVLGAKKP